MNNAMNRFVSAQEKVYANVVAELTEGLKQTHWMWFVFPQLRALGSSPTAQLFGLADLDEAQNFLADDVLGPRLLECCNLLEQHENRAAQQIFGRVDALKLRSSLTLFSIASSNHTIFKRLLLKYFDGTADPQTLAVLALLDPSFPIPNSFVPGVK